MLAESEYHNILHAEMKLLASRHLGGQDNAGMKLLTLNRTHLLVYTYSKVSAHDIE